MTTLNSDPLNIENFDHLKPEHEINDVNSQNCMICRERFSSSDQLADHIQFSHIRILSNNTEVLDNEYIEHTDNTERILTASLLFKNSEDILNTCNSPNAESTASVFEYEKPNYSRLKNLYYSFENRQYCLICDEKLHLENNIEEHLKIHANERFYECPDCGEIFDNLNSFQNHIYVHTPTSTENHSGRDDEQNCFNTDNDILDVISDQSSADKTKEFKCKFSNKHSSKEEDMKNHIKSPLKKMKSELGDLLWQKSDNKCRPYNCNDCNRSFTLASTLSLHKRRIHLGIKPHKCLIFGWTFAQSSDLRKHSLKHTKEKPYACEHCGLQFKQKRNLSNHITMHTKGTIACKHCEREFKLKTSLLQHMKKHEGDFVILCQHCSVPYTSRKYLNLHIKQVHHKNPISNVVCSYCKKNFSNKTLLIKHERKHTGEKPFECKTCGKAFTHQTTLNNHYVVHSGEKSFQCTYCGQSFFYAGNLKVHIRTHTGERPFECKVCAKKFTRTGNLQEHMKVHTGERSFKCNVCSKTFANSSSYAKHKKIHSGERPHKCQICEKSFIQMAHLVKHIRVHTGEKPYSCDICGKRFHRGDTLKSHMNVHKKNISSCEKNVENYLQMQIDEEESGTSY